MKEPVVVPCGEERRRDDVRDGRRNGIDYVEVVDDRLQTELRVHLFRRAPELSEANVRVEGGRRIRGIAVTRVWRDPQLSDTVRVRVDRPGDFSTYCLRLVDAEEGRSTDRPLRGFDPRYATAEFGFKLGCPATVDCARERPCPPPVPDTPEISYLAKDYTTFRRLLLDRLSLILPDWRERHVPDLGLTLVELLAYLGDQLSYYQDAVATEAYLDTARQRISVRRHLRLVDYHLHEGCNARAWLFLHTREDQSLDPSAVYFTTGADDEESQVFEPLVADRSEAIDLFAAHNEIRFYTWGDVGCCLPRGATRATLRDGWEGDGEQQLRRLRHLKRGDFLLLEGMKDPDTSRRHVVRLTEVSPGEDGLYQQPVVEIAWQAEDALPFPLCLSIRRGAPDCDLVEDVSVARGNVLLVDHGRTVEEKDLGEVKVAETLEECACDGGVVDVRLLPDRYEPLLQSSPLTFGQPLRPHASATAYLRQDVRRAVPHLSIRDLPKGHCWEVRHDLLRSGGDDPHVVVEIDDEGRAHLRFGDGDLGRRPQPHAAFSAVYRVGNGPAGNVGAESIVNLCWRDRLVSDPGILPRNPLAATGGTPAETMAEAKLLGPHAFRKDLQRAITADDYARLAERENPVALQRAGAALRWNGSWYEAHVAVDPRGSEESDGHLLRRVRGSLHRFRRMGHDLEVASAVYVPLELVLDICVLPHHTRGEVEAALREALGDFFSPDNLTFGEGVLASRIVAVAQAVPGVQSVCLQSLRRLGETSDRALLELGPLEIAQLDSDADFPEHGILTLCMKGGR